MNKRWNKSLHLHCRGDEDKGIERLVWLGWEKNRENSYWSQWICRTLK